MIHGYHVIFCTYGFWLPNDPRGAWSDFVGKWELLKFGPASKTLDRKLKLTAEEFRQLALAKQSLLYPSVQFNDRQIELVGLSFQEYFQSHPAEVWACSILPDHVHLVIGRHKFKMEQLVRLLKGAATKRLLQENQHPLFGYLDRKSETPSPWSVGKWIVYLDSEEAIVQAIRYVEDNPEKEDRSRQHWSFVLPFGGLNLGAGWMSY